MKIAVVTDDQKTISAHFGRAQYYLVFSVEEGKISGVESRPKTFHGQPGGPEHHASDSGQHGNDPQAASVHADMLAPIADCNVLLARGMGQGAHDSMLQRNIRPIITEVVDARTAVETYLAGSLVDHPEKLH
jgi:predicted Fe-Mo cluster-binding NifX family protein